jgi:hypothetical protein
VEVEMRTLNLINRGTIRVTGALILVAAIVIGTGCYQGAFAAAAQPVKQKFFKSPDEAVKAFMEALRVHDEKELSLIFGPSTKELFASGDPMVNRAERDRFIKAYDEMNRQDSATDTKVVLYVGKEDWPFAIPIMKGKEGWFFDTDAGKEELLNRRIGRNELNTIQTCLAYVDAQREYALKDRDNNKLLEYAQKIRSDKGKRNGLYWEAKPGEEQSPLGSFFAKAVTEGYSSGKSSAKPEPYHGYYYKILTAQGKNAPGGEYDYLVKGKMIGGFALVAYPAEYGNSGVMTFIVNHDGVVYQKDLGKDTGKIAGTMTKFDPDKAWKRVD